MSFSAGCGNNGNFVASAHRTAVRARAGHVTKGINGVLHRGGTISGVVRNAHGKPLSGICLQLEPFVGDCVHVGLFVRWQGLQPRE